MDPVTSGVTSPLTEKPNTVQERRAVGVAPVHRPFELGRTLAGESNQQSGAS